MEGKPATAGSSMVGTLPPGTNRLKASMIFPERKQAMKEDAEKEFNMDFHSSGIPCYDPVCTLYFFLAQAPIAYLRAINPQ